MTISLKKFDSEVFAERLRSRMADLSYNQSVLADITDINQTTISKYINKKQEPVVSIAATLAQALLCDLSWLLGLRDDGGPTSDLPGSDYVGPVSALEKTALTKALTVLRSKAVRGQPDQALAASIDTFYVMVEDQRAELGANGGLQHGEGGATSSARRRRQR